MRAGSGERSVELGSSLHWIWSYVGQKKTNLSSTHRPELDNLMGIRTSRIYIPTLDDDHRISSLRRRLISPPLPKRTGRNGTERETKHETRNTKAKGWSLGRTRRGTCVVYINRRRSAWHFAFDFQFFDSLYIRNTEHKPGGDGR